jgi:hypothetical protein
VVVSAPSRVEREIEIAKARIAVLEILAPFTAEEITKILTGFTRATQPLPAGRRTLQPRRKDAWVSDAVIEAIRSGKEQLEEIASVIHADPRSGAHVSSSYFSAAQRLTDLVHNGRVVRVARGRYQLAAEGKG